MSRKSGTKSLNRRPILLTESNLVRRLYDRCQKSTQGLMPHRRLLWESALALEAVDGLKILNVNSDGPAFERFLAEKGLRPGEVRTIGYHGAYPAAIFAPPNPLPFAPGYFDRIFCLDPSKTPVNKIFFINELKRVLKSDGLMVFLDEKTGPVSSWREGLDHLWRVRRIRGLGRRAAAVMKLASAAPALGLKGLLARLLPAGAFPTGAFADSDIAHSQIQDPLGNNIYISSLKAIAKTDPLVDAFVRFSTKFDLQYPSTTPPSERIVNVDLDDLRQNPRFFNELAVSYQKIFGSSEVWAEGAYCRLDPRHLISLEEYNDRLATGDLKCVCGGSFKPCYSRDYFKSLMTDQMTKSKAYNPFCSLYVADGQVSGFMWGAVATLDGCVDRMLATPNWVDRGDWRTFVMEAKETLKDGFGLNNESRLFFIDDLGVLPSARKGVDPMMLLARQAFSHAAGDECRHALCWTSKKTPLFKILRFCAFREVLTNKSGITFMYCEDIVPGLKILQSGPRAIVPIMIGNAKLFERKTPETT